MTNTNRHFPTMATAIAKARDHAQRNARTARYWAQNARRDLRRGDTEEAFKSLLIAYYDRHLARGWRKELQRLEMIATRGRAR